MVAVATTCTAEVRMPAMISGMARGTSTRRTSWPSERPMPRAASRTSSGTSAMPT